MGIIGIVVIFIIFIAKLASLECLGTSYLTPISPLYIKSLKNSFIRFNRKSIKKRPEYLTNNIKRMDDQ
jgi:spore germination protein KA